MHIYAIRHTSVSVPAGICYGKTDVALSESFEEELKQYKNILPSSVDRVYSSPLSRCRTLASGLSADYTTDLRLSELDFGDWEFMPWDQIPPEEINPWYKDIVNIPPKNGEKFLDMFNRVQHFMTELRQEHHENVLIISHAGVIRCFWAILLQIPLENAFRIPVNYGDLLSFHLGKTTEEDYITRKQ